MDVPHTFPKRDGSPAVAEMFPEHAFWWLASPGNSPQDSMQSSIIPIMHTQQLTQCLLHSLQWKMFISPWRWWWHGDIHSLGGNILVHRRPWYNAMRRCMKGAQHNACHTVTFQQISVSLFSSTNYKCLQKRHVASVAFTAGYTLPYII